MFLPLFPLLLPPLLTSALASRLRIMQNKRVFFVTERKAVPAYPGPSVWVDRCCRFSAGRRRVGMLRLQAAC